MTLAMMFPFQLDVIFTQEGPLVSVTSKAFPGCLGVGLNENEAVTDLKRSVKSFIKESVDEVVDRLFSAPVREHIRLAPNQTTKRVSFDLRSHMEAQPPSKPHKNLMVSFPLTRFDVIAPDDWAGAAYDVTVSAPPPGAPNDVHNLFEQLGLGFELAGVHPGAMPFVSSASDAMIMGFPLHLN